MCQSVYNDEGKFVSGQSGLSRALVQHHSVLSTPKALPHYDSDFKVEVERTVSAIDNNEIVWQNKLYEVPLSVQEVTKARNSLKKNKASGWDLLTAKHFMYGGLKLMELVTSLLNAMILNKYSPDHFKKGVKINIFKGGDRDTAVHDNYRGITLLSTFGKLYETALLIRSELWFEQNVDKRQGVAQSNCSSLHSSLLLKESINCLTEGGSTAYVVLLNAKQTFDCVWIDDLFYQLCKSGLDYVLWNILRSYYAGCYYTVRVAGIV